ncbi:hypothetical protein [macacine gammaherpesvirus 13]|uniref:EBNA-3C n=1 Tax=macacine gammaherpesvirus 13 TaxID=2341050 RepID=A0A3G1T4E7_9GAMA|nr:hypothetical protein QKT43_gp37 [Macaca arctoides gammaherpesvirus 1]AYA49822.1 hypothetical protein [Macaca arctoides gammaherpesvirus 1]
MESGEGEGDKMHSPNYEPGENVHNTGETGPQSSGASAGSEPGTDVLTEAGHQMTEEQADAEGARGWRWHMRRRRRRRLGRSGHFLNPEGSEPPWMPSHPMRPYTARDLRDAACQAAALPDLQRLSNLIVDSNASTERVLSYVMGARQRFRDVARGPATQPGWRYWILRSPTAGWPMGFRTTTLSTRTPVPQKVGAKVVKLTATLGCQAGERNETTFSASVWVPPRAGVREQDRCTREADVLFLRCRWQRRYRVIFDLIEAEKSLRHIWQNRLQSDDDLLNFVRFMGVMSSCQHQSVRWWFCSTLGNYRPTLPWHPSGDEPSHHARRGLDEVLLERTFRRAQMQGLQILLAEGGPHSDDISETSSEEDADERDSDPEPETSDEELPYIAPDMEPPRRRPVLFAFSVPRRKLMWPTPLTHPVEPTVGVGVDSAEEGEEHGPSPQPDPPESPPSVPQESHHQAEATLSIVTVHEPPREPPATSSEATHQRVKGRRGACAVDEKDVIEVIEVDDGEPTEGPARKRHRSSAQATSATVPTQGVRPSTHADPSMPSTSGDRVSRPTLKDGSQRPGKRKKGAAPSTAETPATAPFTTPPSRFCELLRERLLGRYRGYKAKSFWEMRAGHEDTPAQEHISEPQPSPPRPPRIPSVYALPAIETAGDQVVEVLSSPSPPQQQTTHPEYLQYEESGPTVADTEGYGGAHDEPEFSPALYPEYWAPQDQPVAAPEYEEPPSQQDKDMMGGPASAQQAVYAVTSEPGVCQPQYSQPIDTQAPETQQAGPVLAPFPPAPHTAPEPQSPQEPAYLGSTDPQFQQAQHPEHQEPQVQQAQHPGQGGPPFQVHPYGYSSGMLGQYPGYAGPWGPWSQYSGYGYPWSQWPQHPGYGYPLPPWAPWPPYPVYPYPPGSQAPYTGQDQGQPTQAPYPPPPAAPIRPQVQQVPYAHAPNSAPVHPQSSPPRQAPLRPVPTRLPPPTTLLQDSMAASADPLGPSFPSVLFASDLNQGAFTPVGTEGPDPRGPYSEEGSHGPIRGSDESGVGTQAVEAFSEDSDISEGPKGTKLTDYDASPESDLE